MSKNAVSEAKPHIQALRGFAIITVLLYHLDVPGFRSGFLGVDVFFVISGFLITGSVVDRLDAGKFSVVDFYGRRVRRLLPAAYVTLFATALLAPFFLTSTQMEKFRMTMVGAVTFSANIVLWMQSGYFDVEASSKPLLHFWSLAIEEQYYLIIPVVLAWTAGRAPLRLIIIGTLTTISLLTCFGLSTHDPAGKFYLIQNRAWELGIGSLGAMLHMRLQIAAARVRHLALIGLLALPFLSPFGAQPGWAAVGICVCTLAVILGYWNASAPARVAAPVLSAAAAVGDFSYSLYLVHWPIIVFMKSGFLSSPPLIAYVITLALCIGAGYALYAYVERPIRYSGIEPSVRSALAVLSASAVLLVVPFQLSNPWAKSLDFAELRRLNYGFDEKCDQQSNFEAIGECRTSDKPKIMIWGDSHAMHLLPALKGAPEGVSQATRSGCPPVLSVAPFVQGSSFYTAVAAQSCIDFNDSVLRYLEKDKSTEVVAISAAWGLFRDTSTLEVRGPDGFKEGHPAQSTIVSAMTETVAKLRAMGKRVVLVGSPPWPHFNVGACLERHARGLIQFGHVSTCDFPESLHEAESAPEIALEEAIAKAADVSVIGLVPTICPRGVCEVSPAGKMLYIDDSHLTIDGARYLGERMKLADTIISTAR